MKNVTINTYDFDRMYAANYCDKVLSMDGMILLKWAEVNELDGEFSETLDRYDWEDVMYLRHFANGFLDAKADKGTIAILQDRGLIG